MKNTITKIPSHYRRLNPSEYLRPGDILKWNKKLTYFNGYIGDVANDYLGSIWRRKHVANNPVSKSNFAKVKQEVKRAYCESTRNLHFKASGSVGIEESVKIMAEALGCGEYDDGYNNFKPSCFRNLPSGTKITLAREGSVCAYINPPKGIPIQYARLVNSMLIDELYKEPDGSYRLWWD